MFILHPNPTNIYELIVHSTYRGNSVTFAYCCHDKLSKFLYRHPQVDHDHEDDIFKNDQ